MFLKKPDQKFKDQEAESKTIGFEPEDKPTPLVGKFLLLAMAGLLIFLGTQGLRDIGNIPKKPQTLSYCSESIYSNFSYPSPYSQTTGCQFSKYETKHGIPEIHKKYEATSKEISSLNQQKSTLSSQLTQLRNQITSVQREYDLSLQENIANEATRIGQTPDQLRQSVQSLKIQAQTLETELSAIEGKMRALEPTLNLANKELENASKKAQADYNHDKAIYSFKVFILQTIFVFPLFVFFLKLYFRLKAKDSPHTIIATTLVGVSGLFVFGITITYLWSSFLQDILEEVFRLILDLPIFRTVFYYIAMLVIVAVFGGSVYHLQKKIFDPHRVQLRRLRSKKCPYCEFPFGFTKDFCPSCGKKLMEKCPACGGKRYTIMKHCPDCGTV